MSQLPFKLDLPPRYGRDDFLMSSSNRAALEAIDRWPDWTHPVLLIVGPPGSGKSHLCHVWAERARARMIGVEDFKQDPPALAATHAAIDGADALGLPEAAFFHFLNLMRQAHLSLLVTARQPPDRWGVQTADLLSRLRQAPAIAIEPPDGCLMRSVLVKLFDDRQIKVDAALIDYLTLRLDRSLDAARIVVEALDDAGLRRGRRITRAMASEILETLALDDE